MENYKILKLPIVILSSKRTGSTALAMDISTQHENVPLLIEPSESNEMPKLLSLMLNKVPYILKIHAYDLLNFYPSDVREVVIQAPTLIRIRRKNLIDQLASHYLASYRNIWGYDQNSPSFSESIIIDPNRMARSISFISAYNRAVNNYKIAFTMDKYYEDLLIVNANTRKTPYPNNYNNLLNEFAKLLRK